MVGTSNESVPENAIEMGPPLEVAKNYGLWQIQLW